MLNKDYKEILQCLAAEKVKFLLVGAYALAVHGYPRATMDIDIWVMPSPDNAEAVLFDGTDRENGDVRCEMLPINGGVICVNHRVALADGLRPCGFRQTGYQ